MSKAFGVVENKEDLKREYPELPFVVNDGYGDKFLVFYDDNTEQYRYLDLSDGTTERTGYDSLEDMFEDNEDDRILETELVIKGLYK
jgi:hypothetical protein